VSSAREKAASISFMLRRVTMEAGDYRRWRDRRCLCGATAAG